MTFWIAQGIGVLICLLASYGYFRKTRARFLRVQVAINILYTVEYLLLGVWSGAVANLISTAKFLSFEKDAAAGKKTTLKKSLIFCILSVVFGIAVFDGWLSVIPIFVAVMVTFSTAQENPVIIRLSFALANVLWIAFNFAGRAYVSAVYSAVELVVSVVSLVLILKGTGCEGEENS